ncbi:Nicotinamide/nicotinic acid mononucleotide adenylyltransferase 1 [Sphaceloma murrayae]|uniref:Nicotinamide/nicotinic acid mononucleotide adenylyltransferase 1 n=1 Tax=Sphaceloma murrayae TaxID=2082308 RepID=A0A2K1QL43_9PEZI|nr:Nicotinamide/nicotinic acid mononucleotide adenylyltransferase 1 [Sphaceloma murrayae]
MAGSEIKNLNIAVVGAGMGGLTTALALAKQGFTNVHVYEHAPGFGFVGAGIQLAPNMARILDRLGVWKQIAATATECKDTSIRQGSSDQELSHVKLANVRELYGYPHMVGHRADLAGGLLEGCQKESGVTFHFGHVIESVESWGPQPSFKVTALNEPTKTVTADVLLAADGVKSRVRDAMLKTLNIEAKIIDTNQAAYRIMLKRSEMESDPELLALIDSDTVTRWIGPKRHIIAYPVSNKQIYNLSTAQPDTHFAAAPSATYTTSGDKSVMMDVYGDFCPMVKRMLDKVPDGEVVEWKLRVHEPLPTWVHQSTALIGDACHPTLPHLAQGAAQAIEDGAVLGEVLAQLPDTSPQSITKALKVYELVRKDRAYSLVELAAASGRELHLGSGEAQKARDQLFKSGGKNPDKWADADVQKEIYGHDCMVVAREGFTKMFGEVAVNGKA